MRQIIENLTEEEIQKLKWASSEMRLDILSLCHECGDQKGHLGGCMSTVEILAVLYLKVMNFEIVTKGIIPWENRDRFIMSKGHAGIAMYAALKQAGILTQEILDGPIRGDNTIIFRHPKRNTGYAIECSVGSLGLGLGYGIGLAEAFLRRNQRDSRVYVMLGDGECNEGSIWEGASYAGHRSLKNLVVIVDKNKLQLDGYTKDVLNMDNIGERWKAFGFKTIEIDGHDIKEIYRALKTKHQNKPLAIIANTIKGKGVSFAENKIEWHDNYLTDELYKKAVCEINTFKKELFPNDFIKKINENKDYYPIDRKNQSSKVKNCIHIDEDVIDKWAKLGPKLIIGEISEIFAEYDEYFTLIYADCASRIGIEVLNRKHSCNMMEAGIAEQNQICMAAAMANEGYHVFAVAYAPFVTARVLDQIRVNLGYMRSPVKLIGLAAGFAAGDLGATHTALEDVGNLRGIPNMIVVSPADCTEAVKAMQALIGMNQPAYLRLTVGAVKQKVYQEDYVFEIGKAIVLEEGTDIVIFACGTIISNVIRAAEKLKEYGISCKVINMHTIKPIDERIIDCVLTYKMIVSVEEHSVIGGLGTAIGEYLSARSCHAPLIKIGVQDIYFVADIPQNLLEKAGLSVEKIVEKILHEYHNLR